MWKAEGRQAHVFCSVENGMRSLLLPEPVKGGKVKTTALKGLPQECSLYLHGDKSIQQPRHSQQAEPHLLPVIPKRE